MKKIFNAYLKNNPPPSTFVGNNSFIDICPSYNIIKWVLYKGGNRSRGGTQGVYLNILVLNINDLKEY